jgi:PAS domain S-box-containing protein
VKKEADKKFKRRSRGFRISLRYKSAVPALIFITLMLLLIFRTTYRTVRQIVLEHNQERLLTIADVFAESVRVPLILRNQEVLDANIGWMAKRPDVLGVSVEDSAGVIMGAASPSNVSLATSFMDSDFLGVQRVTSDAYAVAVPIRHGDERLGRVVIFFFQTDIEAELRHIFIERFLMAFSVALFLAFLIAGLTWMNILPLSKLEKTARQILEGDLTARVRIRSYDEIQDLAEAFNEMVARLTRSFENLRVRTEALEESEEKYRLIVEDASDVIFLLSADGEIVLLNKGFSGLSRDEFFLGGLERLLVLHTTDSRERFQDAVVTVVEKKVPVTNLPVTHMHQANHTEVFYLVNLTPVMGPEKNVKLIQVVMRDVTELRRIEMMKDSLIRDVAHELKTPTSKFEMAVHWFENELKTNQEAEKYKAIVKILKTNADRLMRTISSILDLTKLEAGMQNVEMKTLDLNKLLIQVCQDMGPLCREKGIVLDHEGAKTSLEVRGDWDMLYRLIVNLIGNAIKFTTRGRISVRAYEEEGCPAVAVRDTGIGIAQEDLERIFERFVQKSASSTGIGVGLTISRDIAALHQAKVWAESEGIGKGSVFKVQFPSSQGTGSGTVSP